MKLPAFREVVKDHAAERGSTPRPPSNFRLPFGKHRGLTLDQIPQDYLLWVLDSPTTSPTVKRVVASYLEIDQAEDTTEPDPASAAFVLPGFIFTWWSAMQTKYAGDPAQLAVVAEGLEALKRLCAKYTRKPWPNEP